MLGEKEMGTPKKENGVLILSTHKSKFSVAHPE